MPLKLSCESRNGETDWEWEWESVTQVLHGGRPKLHSVHTHFLWSLLCHSHVLRFRVSANHSKLLKSVYCRFVGSFFVPDSHKPGKPNIHQSKLLLSSEYQRTRYDISTHNGVPVQLCLSTVRQRKESEMEINVPLAIVPGRIAPSSRQGRNFTLNFLSWQGLKSEL